MSSGAGQVHGTPTSASQGVDLERRVERLEEDLKASQQLLRDCSFRGDAAAEQASVKLLIECLDQKSLEEQRWRQGIEDQVRAIETGLREERVGRHEALRKVGEELGTAMQELIKRVDARLAEETQLLNEREGSMEVALQHLILRVENGLATGALALRETLSTAGNSSGAALQELAAQTKAPAAAEPPSMFGNCRVAALAQKWSKPPSAGDAASEPAVPQSTAMHAASSSSAEGPLLHGSGKQAASIRPGLGAAVLPARGAALASRAPQPATSGAPAAARGAGLSPSAAVPTAGSPGTGLLRSAAAPGAAKLIEATEPLLKVWSELQEENQHLLQRRQLLAERAAKPSNGAPTDRGASMTPQGRAAGPGSHRTSGQASPCGSPPAGARWLQGEMPTFRGPGGEALVQMP